jgi:hypothetical protein
MSPVLNVPLKKNVLVFHAISISGPTSFSK